jgi:hypothetical protein
MRRLVEEYPEARCELDHRSPFELLAATILSAQCTDARVNMVTPALFAAYPTPEDLAHADPEQVEEIIKSTGFYKNKTKSLIGMAQALVSRYDGAVPGAMQDLVPVPRRRQGATAGVSRTPGRRLGPGRSRTCPPSPRTPRCRSAAGPARRCGG